MPVILVLTLLTACSLPQVSAEDRMFLDLSLDLLGEGYLSAETESSGEAVEPLAGLTYGLQPGLFYGISAQVNPDHPAQLYRLKFDQITNPQTITVEAIQPLKDESGQPLTTETLSLESLAFSPRKSVFIAAEDLQTDNASALVGEFDLNTGQLKTTVPLPPSYRAADDLEQPPQGIQPQSGFKSMTIGAEGFSAGGFDPFRLFIAPEAPLFQDVNPDQPTAIRMLHYLIADRASFLVSENWYPLDPPTETESPYQLVEMIAVPESGNFITLEQSQTATGYTARIYQIFTGNATDTSRIFSLQSNPSTVQPIQKKLLLDLADLEIPLQPFDDMTLGPKLPNQSQSLILMSHDTKDTASSTQFLLFNLKRSA